MYDTTDLSSNETKLCQEPHAICSHKSPHALSHGQPLIPVLLWRFKPKAILHRLIEARTAFMYDRSSSDAESFNAEFQVRGDSVHGASMRESMD